jgi:hypothetical protein
MGASPKTGGDGGENGGFCFQPAVEEIQKELAITTGKVFSFQDEPDVPSSPKRPPKRNKNNF